jgi:acetate kinase
MADTRQNEHVDDDQPTPVMLVLNVGSATLKCQVFSWESQPRVLWGVTVEQGSPVCLVPLSIPSESPSPAGSMGDEWRETNQLSHNKDWDHFVQDVQDTERSELQVRSSGSRFLPCVLRHIQKRGWQVKAAGHRIVHGGPTSTTAKRLDPQQLDELKRWASWAPLHQAENLSGVEFLFSSVPDSVQVGCFDTAFHQSMPAVAKDYAIPEAWRQMGYRRFGFHGLSYQSIVQQIEGIPELRDVERIVVAHLGSGASLCGLKQGVSVATTMGLTPLDGLPMSTRCGAIDPGLILDLMLQHNLTPEQIRENLYRHAGWLGLSGISGDMRVLLGSTLPAALQAVEHFVYRTAQEIAATAVALGGLDAIIFTGGVGQNSAVIRTKIVDRLAWMGVRLDPVANQQHSQCISQMGSSITAHVLPAREEQLIAQQTWETVLRMDQADGS